MHWFNPKTGEWEDFCDRCSAPIVTKVHSPAGNVEYCHEHTALVLGKAFMQDFELHHRPFADHIGDAMRAPQNGPLEATLEARQKAKEGT